MLRSNNFNGITIPLELNEKVYAIMFTSISLKKTERSKIVKSFVSLTQPDDSIPNGSPAKNESVKRTENYFKISKSARVWT